MLQIINRTNFKPYDVLVVTNTPTTNRTSTQFFQVTLVWDRQCGVANGMWVVTLAPVQPICLADKPNSYCFSTREPMFPS